MAGTGIIFYGVCFTTVSFAPGSIGANTSSEVAVTMPGILASDVVIAFIKPTLTAGIDVGSGRVSAANTVRVLFQNSTASPIVVPTETYTVVVMRPEKTLGGPDALSGGSVIFQ